MLNLNIDDFLKNYWQKKPLLIRAAFKNFKSPITAEELAGLACEDFVESRIISQQKTSPNWMLENGPFPESRFTELPKSHWTLLIQGLNKILPEFDDLLHEFDFIPSWRIDDLMASYAAPSGSVGPHIDQYDVFLLQATGKRKWMINEKAVKKDNFEENLPIKIIKEFKAETEWILEAGDMLYLPANIAHHGIAMENCMTFSIGFRAPSYAELLSAYIDDHISELDEELRYQDHELLPKQNHGEITAEAINKIQEILLSQFSDKRKIADWFGQYITESLNDDSHIEISITPSDFLRNYKKSGSIRRPATVKANYYKDTKGELALYINGIKQKVTPETEKLVMLFCDQHLNNYSDLKNHLTNKICVNFLCELYNNGHLEFSNE